MEKFEIILVLVSLLIPIGFIVGFYIAVKIDIAKIQVELKYIKEKINHIYEKFK